jgi:hypothetical protein
MSTPKALRDVQSHFGARRSSCDESGQFCWDTIDSAIAEIERLTALVIEAPHYFHPGYDFDGKKLQWLERAGLVPTIKRQKP